MELKTWLKQGSNGRHQATAIAITQVSVATVATWAILANYGLKTRKKGKNIIKLEYLKFTDNLERSGIVNYRYPDL